MAWGETIFAAAILAFVPKRQPIARDATVVPELPQPAQPLLSAEPNEITAERACAQFLAELSEFYAGEHVPFTRIRNSYARLRRDRYPAWPILSDKVLSRTMCAIGCKRDTLDLRSKGKGRQVHLLLPYDRTEAA